MLAITLKVISVGFFLTMAALIKTSPNVPTGQLIFFRSFFAILPILIFLGMRGELRTGMVTKHPFSHLLRGLLGVLGMSFFFFAVVRLPLPESIAINYTMPLLIVVFGAIFLHEQVRLYRWSAVLVGMIGVGIILWPRLTVFSGGLADMSAASLGALAALCGCVCGATSTLQVRRLLETEGSATIVIYFSVISSVVGLLTIPFGWVMPSPAETAMLIGAGVAGGIGQILMTEAYRHAEVSVVAPFEYTSLLLSIGVGYLVFADVPTAEMMIGAAIVVGAGIFIIWREHALGLERGKARQFVPPQG